MSPTRSTLPRLSDSRLLSRLDTLVRRERGITLCIIDHLVEVQRRDLHLREGYGSMFAYCTRRLGYSASAANRRIRTARCIRRFPRVRELLEANRVNLTTVSMVAGIMTDDNHAQLLSRIAGRTQNEVERIRAMYEPRGAVRDSIRSVCVRRDSPAPTPATNRTPGCEHDRNGGTSPASDPASAGIEPRRDGVAAAALGADCHAEADGGNSSENNKPETGDLTPPGSDGVAAGIVTPAISNNSAAARDDTATTQDTESRVIIRFAAPPEVAGQIEAARSLLSLRIPSNAPLAQVLEIVLEEFLERNDPSRRHARRVKRKNKTAQQEKATGDKTPALRGNAKHGGAAVSVPRARDGSGAESGAAQPRAIPAARRDEVMAASGHRCEFVSRTGVRCTSTRALQVDHRIPVALGGTAERENLRVLCGPHNRLEAERLLGPAARAWRPSRG